MNLKDVQKVEEWAVEAFGAAELGDPRRTERLVKIAAALGENPSVSLPASMRNWADTQGMDRFLGHEAQIMLPHWTATSKEAAERRQVLMIGDTTEVNLSTHQATTGRTQQQGDGLRMSHSVLALDALTLRRIFLNWKKKSEAMRCKSVAPFLPPKCSFFERSSL
jgi:hypothetical protein